MGEFNKAIEIIGWKPLQEKEFIMIREELVHQLKTKDIFEIYDLYKGK